MSETSKTVLQDSAYLQYRQERTSHWNRVAKIDQYGRWNHQYHQRLVEVYRFLIPPGQQILEVGCGSGDLLAALNPSVGLGIDSSEGMVKVAQQRHPHIRFIQADLTEMKLDETFDIIILSDSLNEFWDVQTVFENLTNACKPTTRLIINNHSRLWELPLNLVQSLGMAIPTLQQNWLTVPDTINLLLLTNYNVIRNWEEIILPFYIPLITPLFNRFLVRLWPFKALALSNFILARPDSRVIKESGLPRVSVVIPARNEAGNIRSIFERVPEMGEGTELIFVEGHSTDNTYETIQQVMSEYPNRQSQLLRQPGKGKGDAVRTGFTAATGDILMILDADLTVPPEDLPRFYEALVSGKGEFVNGVRLIYPMEKQAMRFFNLLGNKFFSLAFSWLLGQPVKDTLCGTKVLWKWQYEAIAANRSYFGDFDPFGDFDLLFGAARLNYKILDMPIRYRERVYGTTNIQRWKHGWLLIKMVAFAARRIKFI